MFQQFEHSPYLTRLVDRYPELCGRVATEALDSLVKGECFSLPDTFESQQSLMKALREAKGKLALLVAIGDVVQQWPLGKITRYLSEFADYALGTALDFLLQSAAKRGDIVLPNEVSPSVGSGIIVLGMGKLGAFELNYSSDIDIIIFFEPEQLGYKGRQTEQHFMNKLAQDIVQIMQERTVDGYVFRTDLRLRPDPASTPPAVTTHAAMLYYESVGQNWERAAMIKARPVAGDIVAGDGILKALSPYMWRRNLDFAAINDIHSIKRQMDARAERVIRVPGHNIKLGQGGIREIEFYTQIHQLIWGGRKPALRTRGTCETLKILVEEALIPQDTCESLIEAYHFYRMVEHRLQMVADEQTHTLPDRADDLEKIALFCGFNGYKSFEEETLAWLQTVHDIYANSFVSADELGSVGNLVFTGVSHDPDTLQTIAAMGYKNPEVVSEIIMGWHHGSKRCTRTKRARELLTELMPALLTRLSQTANPDAAFLKFDEFLTDLPAAIQLFSLFQANPKLLGLIADIMGSAPSLAETLARAPELIENVLFSDFYKKLPSKGDLLEQAKERIAYASDLEETVEYLTRFKNERQFQAGVHFLRDMVGAHELGLFLSDLAESMLALVLKATQDEFEKTYGRIPGSAFAIIGLGKLGSRELTFHSDLDLVFVYRVPDFELVSDGEKGFTASIYYNRFAQRLVNVLSALGGAGKMYDIDTRLRPSGKQGLLAVSDKALAHYFEELAWTFEFMAFTKANTVVGDKGLCEELNQFIATLMTRPRDAEKLRLDVADMRNRMTAEYKSNDIWDIKYVRGGLVDIDFIAQYLLLLHAPERGDVDIGSAREIFLWCKQHGLIPSAQLEGLLEAEAFLMQLFHMLRLCTGGKVAEENMLIGLKMLLCHNQKVENFEQLKEKLVGLEQTVYSTYLTVIDTKHRS